MPFARYLFDATPVAWLWLDEQGLPKDVIGGFRQHTGPRRENPKLVLTVGLASVLTLRNNSDRWARIWKTRMTARTQELIGLKASGRHTMLAKQFTKAGYHIVVTFETKLRTRMPGRVGDSAVFYAD